MTAEERARMILAEIRSDPLFLAEVADRDAKLDKMKREVVDKLALENFGIAANHSDGISAAHPALAGVIRRALREAYQAGGNDLARDMLQQVAAERAKGR